MTAKLQHSNLDFANNRRIVNLPASVADGQPVIHQQLIQAMEGIIWKDDAAAAASANINLASPGATIGAYTPNVGDRIVVPSQTLPAENGLYIWNGAAVPMTRALDASTAAEVTGMRVPVAGTIYQVTSIVTTLGTDPVTFTTLGGASPPASETVAGIAEVATQIETDAGLDDTRFVPPLKLANSVFTVRRFAATQIGDGTQLNYTVTHNLGTQRVNVLVQRSVAPFDFIDVYTSAPTVNTVSVEFDGTAPTANQFTVYVTTI